MVIVLKVILINVESKSIDSLEMRKNYAMGVKNYYELNSQTYRNPHFEGVKKSLFEFLKIFLNSNDINDFVDLSCGS